MGSVEKSSTCKPKSESPLNLSLSLIRPSSFFNFNFNLKTPTITTSATHSSSNERGDGVSSWSNNSLVLAKFLKIKFYKLFCFLLRHGPPNFLRHPIFRDLMLPTAQNFFLCLPSLSNCAI